MRWEAAPPGALCSTFWGEMLNEIEPSLFEDLQAARTISVGSSENYALILRLDNKTYYFDHGTGNLDGTSIEGAPPTQWDLDSSSVGEGE